MASAWWQFFIVLCEIISQILWRKHIWIAIPSCLSAGTAEKMPESGIVLDNWGPTHNTKQVNCISSCRRPVGFLQLQGYLEWSAQAHQRRWRPLLDVCRTHRPPAAADCRCLTSQPQRTRTPDSQQKQTRVTQATILLLLILCFLTNQHCSIIYAELKCEANHVDPPSCLFIAQSINGLFVHPKTLNVCAWGTKYPYVQYQIKWSGGASSNLMSNGPHMLASSTQVRF